MQSQREDTAWRKLYHLCRFRVRCIESWSLSDFMFYQMLAVSSHTVDV